MRTRAVAASLAFPIVFGLAPGRPLVEQAVPAVPLECKGLASLALAHTTITTAETVAAGAFTPPHGPAVPGSQPSEYSRLPAFCRVVGSIRPTPDSDIRFEVWLPSENWNGKFLQTGNGGAAGAIVYPSMADPLMRGYAVANTDTGHEGAGGDFSWAVDHPEKMIDYDYRAVHELTIVGKAIVAAEYGRGPATSYWVGCSTGGRQGLKEAQRYPDDYDGIIAGAPASNWSPLMALSVHIQRNLGPGGLGLDKLPILQEGAIAACDALDGLTDRVIAEPGRCRFDPASLQCRAGESRRCLSPDEVAAAKRIYAGVVDRNGNVLIPGTGPASELLWAAYVSPQFRIGTNYFRNLVVHDATWDPAAFDVDRDLAAAERIDGGAAKAMDPDLSAFIGRGGRLITYHGSTDGLIPFGNSVNYYESVVHTLGENTVRSSVRFYLVPGMNHCSGGEGAFEVDWLAALEKWVENGQAPEALPATHPVRRRGPPGTPGDGPFTRPVCPWPLVAKYEGSGDASDAASFACAAR